MSDDASLDDLVRRAGYCGALQARLRLVTWLGGQLPTLELGEVAFVERLLDYTKTDDMVKP